MAKKLGSKNYDENMSMNYFIVGVEGILSTLLGLFKVVKY